MSVAVQSMKDILGSGGWLESAEMVMYDWALSSRPIVDQADPQPQFLSLASSHHFDTAIVDQGRIGDQQ